MLACEHPVASGSAACFAKASEFDPANCAFCTRDQLQSAIEGARTRETRMRAAILDAARCLRAVGEEVDRAGGRNSGLSPKLLRSLSEAGLSALAEFTVTEAAPKETPHA